MAIREGYIPEIKITDAKIIMAPGWRGFGPQGDRYGHRGFNLVIEDPEMAQELIDMGWNMHIMPPRNEGDAPKHRLPVEVRFDKYPPRVVMVTRRGGEVELGDETIECLDTADFAKLNLTISPSKFDPDQYGGRGTGVKAWLKEMKVWINESNTMADDVAPWDEEY